MASTLRRIGRSLLVPLTLLPAAALFVRLGDLLGSTWIKNGGEAIFGNLPHFPILTRPFLLLAVGALAGLAYFATFAWLIRVLDLPTPGRETDADLDGRSRVTDSVSVG